MIIIGRNMDDSFFDTYRAVTDQHFVISAGDLKSYFAAVTAPVIAFHSALRSPQTILTLLKQPRPSISNPTIVTQSLLWGKTDPINPRP